MNNPEFDAVIFYTVETLVELTGVPGTDIELYQESGLIRPVGQAPAGGPVFDAEAVYRIRRIELLRDQHGINLAGIRLIFDLMNEVHRLEEEMRFLRS